MLTKARFIEILEEVLELSQGTVSGDETLAVFETWDSLAVVGIIASVHAETGATMDAKAVKACVTVPDLVAVAIPA